MRPGAVLGDEHALPGADAAPLEPFRFGQWRGKRLTAHYGSAYDFSHGRLSDAPPLRRYFTLHAVLDVKHSEDWNREAIRPAVEEDPRRATAMAEGALIRLKCGARCFERYRLHFGI